MDHHQKLQDGLRDARARLEQLQHEDVTLARRVAELKADIANHGAADSEALAAVRTGATLPRKSPRGAEALQHELDTLAAARRALLNEIQSANAEVGSLARAVDRLVMRDIGARAIANGARIDRLLADLVEACGVGEKLYAEALEERVAFRLSIQPSLQNHLAGTFRIGGALPHLLRELARVPSDRPHRVEDFDRQHFKQFDN